MIDDTGQPRGHCRRGTIKSPGFLGARRLRQLLFRLSRGGSSENYARDAPPIALPDSMNQRLDVHGCLREIDCLIQWLTARIVARPRGARGHSAGVELIAGKLANRGWIERRIARRGGARFMVSREVRREFVEISARGSRKSSERRRWREARGTYTGTGEYLIKILITRGPQRSVSTFDRLPRCSL